MTTKHLKSKKLSAPETLAVSAPLSLHPALPSSILTWKLKHGMDFSVQLAQARQVAKYAIEHRAEKLTTRHVKHIGLKAAVANQIIRKYLHDRKCRRASRVKLTVAGYFVQVDGSRIKVPCLKLDVLNTIPYVVTKINQVEADETYLYVTFTTPNIAPPKIVGTIGIDLNTTGHAVVLGDPATGRVIKMGRSAKHIHDKYRDMRRYYQKHAKWRKLRQVKRRESNKIKDLNHKMSRSIVDYAYNTGSAIQMEDLAGIRESCTQPYHKQRNHSLNSWAFYQLQMFVAYKALLLGIPVAKINPAYTSQNCSRCGTLGIRDGKSFACKCGHVDHADANASFNIAKASSQTHETLPRQRKRGNGSTDTPREETA